MLTDTPTKLGENGINKIGSSYLLLEKDSASGKHADVFFISTPNRNTELAVKRQYVHSPANRKDRTYRELRILHSLSQLSCEHFVSMIDWFKVRNEDDKENEGDCDDQVMHYVMEYVDLTLNDLKEMTLLEFKSILFQILYALYLAQVR